MSEPFVWKNDLTLTWRTFDHKYLSKLLNLNGFSNMGVALADLGVGTGTAYGWNADQVGYAASLTKIAAMYAAYQLQASLQKIPGAGLKSLRQLEDELKKDWRTEINKHLPARGARNDFPQLELIFAPKNAGFAFSKTFDKNLKDMIGPSKNYAAQYCIRAIGFDYLAASLVYGGFYSLANSRGMWLSGDYNQNTKIDGVPVPGVTTIKEPSQRFQVATAEAVTLFMVNLGRDQLVSATASQEMKAMMWDSYAKRQIGRPGSGNTVVGKIGIQPNNVTYHDCAIVERHCMRYTMTTLFMPTNFEFKLFTELDQIADELFDRSKKACESVTTLIKAFL